MSAARDTLVCCSYWHAGKMPEVEPGRPVDIYALALERHDFGSYHVGLIELPEVTNFSKDTDSLIDILLQCRSIARGNESRDSATVVRQCIPGHIISSGLHRD